MLDALGASARGAVAWRVEASASEEPRGAQGSQAQSLISALDSSGIVPFVPCGMRTRGATMDERQEREQEPQADAPLREEDVTAGDRLDDRVSEGEGLAGVEHVDPNAEYPQVKR